MVKLAGEAARVFETTAGKVALAVKAREDLARTLYRPCGGARTRHGHRRERIYTALKPAAEAIAKEMVPAIEKLSGWIVRNEGEITKWVESAVAGAKNIAGWFVWLQAKSEEALKPIWGKTRSRNGTMCGRKLKAFFTELWANTKKEFDELWPIISKFGTDLWTNTLAEWEKLKAIVAWIDTNIIKPIYNLFTWLAPENYGSLAIHSAGHGRP